MGVHLYTKGAWTDSGKIYRNSLNIFDKNSMKYNAYIAASNGLVSSSQNPTTLSAFIPIDSSTQYTISCISKTFRYGFTADEIITIGSTMLPSYNILDYQTLAFHAVSVTTPDYAKWIVFNYSLQQAEGDTDIVTDTVMVNLGDTALPPEPYNVVDWYTNRGHGYSSGAWS